ncbi:expressed unknown protein [Seminavis robusta]|uniref:Secreted protein n=1 Tax=Seminavis robusta TaxID=568900 RepID=A0A9N8H9B6_9STRA|nr:expressed unknown protein [Seminavis robusta]|eukprot:Sro249_g098680.1 n/a (92) ;mRNA; r:34413-34688
MVLWFLAAGIAVEVAKERDYGERRMKEMEIHSRRTINLPRTVSCIPRAAMQRCTTSSGSHVIDRQLVFDERSGSLFAQKGMSSAQRRLEWS